jgi:hypothetical protein
VIQVKKGQMGDLDLEVHVVQKVTLALLVSKAQMEVEAYLD